MRDFSRLAISADAEVKSGFSATTAQALVSLWGHLEALVDDLVVARMSTDPSILYSGDLADTKMRLSEIMRLTDEDRYRFLARELEQSLARRYTSWPDRGEAVLHAVGLGGRVPKPLLRKLRELYHVRNAIVHCKGVVDQHFVRVCPWTPREKGSPITPSDDDYFGYSQAVLDYVRLLWERLHAQLRQTDGATGQSRRRPTSRKNRGMVRDTSPITEGNPGR